ncbi:MAG: TetR family transcriptional regulator [Candidatus Acidiferrales bacterium]
MRCALRLFADRGFADTSIEDITEAADVGKGTFFNYFPTKEHVLDAFGKSRVAKVEEALGEVRAGTKTVLQAMRQLAHGAASETPLTPRLMRSFLVAALLNDSVRRKMTGNQAQGRRALAEIVAIGQKRGEIRPDIPARHVARAVQQEIFGAFLLWALDPELELTTWLDTWVDFAFFGIVPHGRKGERRVARRAEARARTARSGA